MVLKKVTLELAQIEVTVDVKGTATDNEILATAKLEAIEKLKKQFPSIRYSIAEGDTLSLEDLYCGQIIQTIDGRPGIVYEIKPSRKQPVTIVFSNGMSILTVANNLKACNKSFEEVRNAKFDNKMIQQFEHDAESLYKGITAYFKNGEKYIPVIISKITSANYILDIINEKSHYKVSIDRLKNRLFAEIPKNAKAV